MSFRNSQVCSTGALEKSDWRRAEITPVGGAVVSGVKCLVQSAAHKSTTDVCAREATLK